MDFTGQTQQSLNDVRVNKERKADHRVRNYEETIKDCGQFYLNKYKCISCDYTSSRQYNVLRHEERIHTRKLKRSCCGNLFVTKGEWYLHCEENHPKLRATSYISRQKYKIVKNLKKSLIESEKKIVRRSKRIQESMKNQESMIMEKFDDKSIDEMKMEDIPLIYFIKNHELREKFIEKLRETRTNNDEKKITTSNTNNSNNCIDNINDITQVKNSEADNYVKDKPIHNREILVIKTQTIELMNINRKTSDYNNNCDTKNSFPEITQSAYNLKFSYSNESKISTNIKVPVYLPLKKRILQELRNNSTDKNHQRRYKEKLMNDNKILNINEKENIERTSKNYFNSGSMKKKILMTRAEESFTWNQITQYQRAYLSSIDFDRFKIY